MLAALRQSFDRSGRAALAWWMPAGVTALALLALLGLAQLIVSVMALKQNPAPSASAQSIDQLVASERQAPRSITQWNLFGALSPLGRGRSAATTPDTDLKLTVLGVIAAEDPKLGLAILSGEGVPERGYRPGDEILSGVVVDSVLPDRILLSRAGVLEALRLPRGQINAANAAGAPGGALDAAAAGAAPTSAPNGGAAATTAAAPFVTPMIAPSGMDWNQAVAAVRGNEAELARQVTVLPVIENGAMVGVRLDAGAQQALVAAMGLQPEDVVTAINGIALDSPTRAAEVAGALRGASAVTVTVRRDGRSETLSVTLPR